MPLTKEARDALAPEDFAVPDTRDLPLVDAHHVRMAWNTVSATKDLTTIQRVEARKRISARAKEFGIDMASWKVSPVFLQARSLDIPTDAHPNKMPFSGVLTRIDEPSDSAPEGSGGKRVMITAEAAENALDSLLGMAVDYTPELDGHNPQAKIGVITAATIDGNAILIEGFIYAADFPDIAKEIKANKDALGFSFEARDLMTYDPKADPVPIVECIFTGAAILLKNKAAYTSTSIQAAKQAANEDFIMNEDTKKEFAELLATALKPLSDKVDAQAAEITKIKDADKIEAANHLAKVEKHATELEKAADHMDAAGIGGNPTRGHAAILRNMAGDLRAKAARGELPSAYDGFYAAADKAVTVDADAVKKAVEAAVAPLATQLAEVKAAAEKADKEAADKIAAAETKLADVKAAAEKAKTDNANSEVPARKTMSSLGVNLLAKSGAAVEEGKQLTVAKLDEVLAKSTLNLDERFVLKTELNRAGLIEVA